MPCDIDRLIRQILEFRYKRNWARFHNPKGLALGPSIEAAEPNEMFPREKPEDAYPARVREALADVPIHSPPLPEKFGPDLDEIARMKPAVNDAKYPVEKARNGSFHAAQGFEFDCVGGGSSGRNRSAGPG